MDTCSVGKVTGTSCHLESFATQQSLRDIQTFDSEDIILLKMRLKNQFFQVENGSICNHHKLQLLDYFSRNKRKCCDPFSKHRTSIRGDNLIEINLETAIKSAKYIFGIQLTPGDKLCKSCRDTVSSEIKAAMKTESDRENVSSVESAEQSTSSSDFRRSDRLKGKTIKFLPKFSIETVGSNEHSSQSSEKSEISVYMSLSQEETNLTTILNSLGIFVELQNIKKNKKAIQDLVESIKANFNQKLTSVLRVDTSSFFTEKDDQNFMELLSNLRNGYLKETTTTKKLEILALLPRSWKYGEMAKFFPVTHYIYRNLIKFDRDIDKIKAHDRKKLQRIPDETVECIKKYYISESNTYTLPGKKDYVATHNSEGRKVLIQKKLLLHTVHDLWINFNAEYQGKLEILPKFSFFASLRPVQCVVAGDPGSHVICVCAEHENVKLKLSAWNKNLKYRDLIDSAVCNSNNIQCMLHKCEKCPGLAKIKETAEKDDTYSGLNITYKLWVDAGTKASLESFTEPIQQFKDNLFSNIWELTIHHFISDDQKRYLQHCKDNLEPGTCILIMDFSENYSFVIQKSVQAFYYNNKQATIHPFTMYYKTMDSDELENKNFCIISDTTDHQAFTVYAFMQKVTEVLKKDYSWIQNVIYFSDGAPTQYKNKNHLVDICCHEKDFGLKVVSYNFFGTSHGKTENDGHGATVKRTTSRHSLRSPPEKQITNALEMFEYAEKNIKSIRCLWVSDAEVQAHRRKLNSRFNTARTVKGTRKYHCYLPIDEKLLDVKRTSFAEEKTRVSVL